MNFDRTNNLLPPNCGEFIAPMNIQKFDPLAVVENLDPTAPESKAPWQAPTLTAKKESEEES